MNFKITNILPAFALVLCVLFQHDSVGYVSTNNELISNIDLDSPTLLHTISDTLIIADSLSSKDSSKSKPDTLSLAPDTSFDTEALKSRVKYHSRDSLRVDIENELVYLYGEAVVDYEDLHIKADYIKIDFEKKEISAEGSTDSLGELTGKPEFSQGAQQFRSNSMRYNFNSKKGKISYVITKEGEGYIHGEAVKKDPYNNFFIHNGQYTTCENDTPHYSISARKLKVISNNKIVTGPAYLVIEEIPTPLFIPFGFFPNKKGRSSGLIFPAFGESAQRGFYFQHLGYYLGLNDYVNVALTSDIYTKGSYTLDLSSVYANRYHYRGNLRLSYSRAITSERELPDYQDQRDFHIYWTHSQDPKAKPNSNFSASVNAGTSTYYRNTITSAPNFLSNTLQSSIIYSQTFPESPVTFGISASHSQNTLTHDINVTLPNINFGISRINPFATKNQTGAKKWYQRIGAYYQLQATNYAQTKDSLLFKKETLDNLHNGIQHVLPISTSFKLLKYFSLSPSVNLTDRMYFKTVRYTYNPALLHADTTEVNGFANTFDYTVSAGLSTRIYGMFQARRGPVAAIRHVMNPSIGYSYRPDFGKSSYGYYRYVQDSLGNFQQYSIFKEGVYGYPANGKYGNVNFGLDNNLEMKVRVNSDSGATMKKIKLLESLRISGNYNLAADSMKLSTFGVSGRTILFDKIGINFGGTLDPYAYDANNKDYNRFEHDVNYHWLRLTNINLSSSFSLAPKPKAASGSKKYSKEELENIRLHPEDYIDFNIPYNLSVSYTYSWSRIGNGPGNQTQSASANGDVNLTPKWKVGFNSWYDFSAKRFTNFGLNIYRDLHCWEMRLTWVPFGLQQSYFFQINVKSAILQDLKLMKRKDFYDN